MKTINRLVILLIICSLLIQISLMHGAIPLVLFELFAIPYVFSPIAFSQGSNDVLQFLFALMALSAHVLLVIGLVKKSFRAKSTLLLIGEVELIATIFYLIWIPNHGRAGSLTFYTSIPTLDVVAILTFMIYKQELKIKKLV